MNNLLNKSLKMAFGLALVSVSFATVSCGGDEPEETVSFADVESVFTANCMGCHESGNNYAPIFSGYDDIKDRTMNGALLDRIQSDTQPMPPTGKMSAEDVQVFIDWANDGYLNE